MNYTGFDLGSSSLKIIEATKDGAGFKAVKVLEFHNPLGIMLPPDLSQQQQLAGMVKQVLADNKISTNNLRAALPESMISTKIISTPSLTDAELASAIDWLAEQHIAIPLEEIKVQYEVLYRPDAAHKDEPMRVMLIGVPNTVIANYMKLFELMEIEPVILETQIVSMLRSLSQEDMPTTLFVHIGATTTDFVIVHEKEIVFVYSYASGGRLLTRSIERGLNLDPNQAEEYKKSYGVDPQFLEGKLAHILEPVLRLFVAEVQKALQYFTSQFGTQTVKRIVFAGGGAQLLGLVPSFATQFTQEIIVANPLEHLKADTKTPVPMDRSASFAIAMGLVMRTM